MFSEPRPSTVSISHVIWTDRSGGRHVVRRHDLGIVEVMQAMMTIRRAIDAGEADALCRSAADRIDQPQAQEVLVVTDIFDTVDYFAEHRRPTTTSVHARCRPGTT
jgi:hypothetical protein